MRLSSTPVYSHFILLYKRKKRDVLFSLHFALFLLMKLKEQEKNKARAIVTWSPLRVKAKSRMTARRVYQNAKHIEYVC